MAKRKRERMKQKAIRHKGADNPSGGSVEGGVSAESPKSKPKPQAPPHLAGASPEWRRWYEAVGDAIASSR